MLTKGTGPGLPLKKSGARRLFSISNYVPPGPVCAAYINDRNPVDFLMGPVGSGKTHGTIFKALRYTAMMPPCKDGIIRAKGAVVRTDYRTLYKTTLSSWFSWFPANFPGSKFTGGADRPAVHILTFRTPRGRKIELQVEFQALGDKRIEEVMRGWEGTWAWMNEADLLEEDALDFLIQRTTRFPPKRHLENDADLPVAVFGDLNPPGDPDHWLVKRFKEKRVAGHKLFEQPSGLSPEAENVQNLAKNYYENMAQTLPDWNVRRFVHGKVGYDRSGLPVYPEFDERINVARSRIEPIAGVPIHLGADGGLHPAAVLVQRAPNLQVRVLEEFYFGRIGPTRFGEQLGAALETRYRDCPVGFAAYDPSADYGADKEGGEQSWVDIVRKALGIPLIPAHSNEIPERVEAVRNLLFIPIAPGVPGLIVSPICTMLIKGFMSHYRYKLNPDGSVVNRASPRPEKNEYSNPHDALQYVCMTLLGRAGVIASAAKGMRPGAFNTQSNNRILASSFQV